MNNYNIILAGNPNVGKSTIFNLLTGYRQHTGNWAGKTVDNASGEYTYNKNKYVIYDLPGMYSLVPHSKEEVIARDMVCNNNDIDCIVVVCNAVSLKRGLNLVLQILEVNSNVLLVVNLMDEAKKRGIEIDLRKLSSILGINVVGTSATYNDGIDKLVDGIEYVCKNKNNSSYSLTYDNDIEDNINNVYKYIGDVDKKRWISIRLLCRDIDIYDKYKNKVLDNYLNRVGNIEDRVCSCIINRCHDIYKMCVINRYNKYLNRDKKLDKIITSKFWGIIIMILSLFLLFWLTIVGSNYPSILLSRFLFGIEDNLYNILSFLPNMIRNILVHGVYKTTAWVVSVMLPPMMIFFPLFTILEDMGFLPRIAFNMDNMFSKCDACGKQCLTMCMGIGCNAVGVTGTRIIDNKKERIIAILTNSFMPCNGRYPVIIAVISMFIINYSRGAISSLLISLVLVFVILFSVAITFVVSKILSRLLFKKDKTSFILELPDYRKIRIGHVIVSSLLDRTLFVLGRAVMVAAPCGLVLYLFTNISINGSNIITFLSDKLDLFGCLLGLDGVILLSFLLGLPANEIVLPIILMIYLNTGILTDYDSLVSLKNILISNGWTVITAVNFIIFSIFHFPCGTTLLTIKKETNSYFYTFIAFIIPLLIGIILCLIINFLYNCFI